MAVACALIHCHCCCHHDAMESESVLVVCDIYCYCSQSNVANVVVVGWLAPGRMVQQALVSFSIVDHSFDFGSSDSVGCWYS